MLPLLRMMWTIPNRNMPCGKRYGRIGNRFPVSSSANLRNLSKYRIEEHQMLNFVKHNRKPMNAGKLKEDRVEKFEKLLARGVV